MRMFGICAIFDIYGKDKTLIPSAFDLTFMRFWEVRHLLI